MKLAALYTTFAFIATVVNIASQELTTIIYTGSFSLHLSILVGTATGLVVKYFLDKNYIFRFKVKNASHDTQTFALYTVMGIVTTAVFWGFEFSFDYIFESKELRYVGGVIGLCIGYIIKYELDKKYVFVSRED